MHRRSPTLNLNVWPGYSFKSGQNIVMPPVSISVYSFSIFNVGYATVHATGSSLYGVGGVDWYWMSHIYSVALLPAGSARH